MECAYRRWQRCTAPNSLRKGRDPVFSNPHADSDLSGIAPGTWQLEVANPGAAFTIAPDTVTVVRCP